MIAVSLFSGCGGLDFGMEAAGFHVGFCNDFDKHCCKTLRLNNARHVLHSPIEEISGSDIQHVLGVRTKKTDLVFGGPPCQPFSKSGYWTRGDTLRLDDPRANTLEHYFRIVEDLQPRAFLIENVHGISYSGKEEGFQYILERIRCINRDKGTEYNPVWQVINTAEYGVPQMRVRFFLVALRNGDRFQFPNPTHSAAVSNEASLFDVSLKSFVTAWDAIGRLNPDPNESLTVGGQWGDLLPSIPEGENYLWHTDRKGGLPLFGWRTRYWCFLLKLAKNRPSWTLQAQPGSAIGPFHWANRRLSWKELAAIQTFPATFKIDSPRVEVQRQIGNAVPSLMAEVLGRAIASHLDITIEPRDPLLQITADVETPPAEPATNVAEKYLDRLGIHAPHPGTGKGAAYQKQRQQNASKK